MAKPFRTLGEKAWTMKPAGVSYLTVIYKPPPLRGKKKEEKTPWRHGVSRGWGVREGDLLPLPLHPALAPPTTDYGRVWARRSSTIYFQGIGVALQQWGCSSMVEHVLCMYEVSRLIPASPHNTELQFQLTSHILILERINVEAQ